MPRNATMADAAKHKARSAERAKDVGDHLKRLKGVSKGSLEADERRGPASPLGHGTGSKKARR
jgi:hypothetical protein